MRKYHVQDDTIRYPEKIFLYQFSNNEYLDQYRNLKIVYEEFAKEPPLKTFITYTVNKKFFSIHVFDLRFLVDLLNPKENQQFEEYKSNPDNARLNARLFIILILCRELHMVSDGDKNTTVEVI